MNLLLIKLLLLSAAISGISLAAETDPEEIPLIPAGINTALGVIREGMSVENVVEKFRASYPHATMESIAGGLARSNVTISLGDEVTVIFQVRRKSGGREWVVADASVVWIQDYNKRQAIKVEVLTTIPAESKRAEAGTGQPAAPPESKPEGADKPKPESEVRPR